MQPHPVGQIAVMASLPLLFDRRLHRSRRQRWQKDAPQFLNDIVVAELAERIAIVNRPLRRMLAHGAAATRFREVTQPLRQESWIIASDVIARPGLELVFDDESIPLAAEGLEAFVCLLGWELANDVPGILAQIRHSLKPDGVLFAAVLGGETLRELRDAWLLAEEVETGGATPRVAPFIDIGQWGQLLQRAGFALPVVDSDRRTVLYRDMAGLMSDLRALGLANSMQGRSRRPLTRRLLASLARAYAERFSDPDGRLRATFEIIYLTGWAPHESQQKPLRPGSAKVRLADVLGVEEKKLKPG
ncbi:MAG TPA: SAM-dependent methyltransferase [Aestuariivirgaceae bacterium]